MKNNGLEIATDLKQQRRLWIMERVGWTIMAILIVAALAGVFGGGPLSHATAGHPGSALHVDYDRFARHEAPGELKAHIDAKQAQDNKLRIWISRGYLDEVEIERTVPQADSSQLDDNRVIYIFNVTETNKPAEVSFHLRPKGYGKTAGIIGVVGGPEVQFSQFIYP